jgi:prophage regulatory protein
MPLSPDARVEPDWRVVSRDEAASILGLSTLRLDRLHGEGIGPARIRLSERRVGYRVSDLRAWLDSRVEHAPPLPSAPVVDPHTLLTRNA